MVSTVLKWRHQASQVTVSGTRKAASVCFGSTKYFDLHSGASKSAHIQAKEFISTKTEKRKPHSPASQPAINFVRAVSLKAESLSWAEARQQQMPNKGHENDHIETSEPAHTTIEKTCKTNKQTTETQPANHQTDRNIAKASKPTARKPATAKGAGGEGEALR